MLRIIPDVVHDQTVRALRPDDTAAQAGRLMTEHDISAVIVTDADHRLLGIVTERDLSRRVVAADLSASATPIADIMTSDPSTLSPTDSAYDAMQLMRRLKVRHLPVVDGGQVVGMVSVRDLRHAIAHELEPAHRGVGSALHRMLRRVGI